MLELILPWDIYWFHLKPAGMGSGQEGGSFVLVLKISSAK